MTQKRKEKEHVHEHERIVHIMRASQQDGAWIYGVACSCGEVSWWTDTYQIRIRPNP